ncbi:MAG TPA: copper amine oxidase N-terminal domain-containing protein [Symbiobacteriaceae bacterium]|nr:copper amine oxidase N-terminal domain-containing protein [Symbiobacteriaceae bacterium]
MRRLRPVLALLTALCLLFALVPAASAATDDWNLMEEGLQKANIVIDGRPASFTGYIVNDRTVVPMRALFEALGAKIDWNPDTWTVTATRGSKVIVLSVGKTGAKIDGKDYTLAVPPVLINSKTYVPVRFVIDALQLDIKWDQATWTVNINTGTGCTQPGPTVHEGTIAPGGETWGRCGAPHIVTGTFRVEGKDSPILTIEEGTMIRFENDATLEVGGHAPGGLVVNGKASNPVYFTADTSGPQPGFWGGIRFFNQTLVNDARITGAVVEYAGAEEWGAISIEGSEKMVEVQLNDVTIKESLYAGLYLKEQGRLRNGSGGLKITGTVTAGTAGGFPIVTGTPGSHNLPKGEYTNNAVSAVNLFVYGASTVDIATNTTWRNVGIPYAVSANVVVEGTAAPTLTIDPGVIVLFAHDTSLIVGRSQAGALVADATARPEGGGEWRVEKAELDLGVKLGNAAAIEPQCGLCGQNKAIVFGAWNASPERGAWQGIQLKSMAGDKSKLVGVVIAWGGKDEDYSAGLYAESAEGKVVKFLLAKSLITGAVRSGMEFYENVQMRPESTGNYFEANGWPIRLFPDAIGYLPSGQTFTGNDQQIISVSITGGSSADVTRSATWRNQGIPYQFDLSVYIGGTAKPVVTIEPGTELVFQRDTKLQVGTSDGPGSLVAVGKAGQPIKFSGEAGRPGAWDGINFTSDAGKGNRIEYAVIEYANIAVSIADDMGGFIQHTTIRSSAQMGIYRDYGTGGTSFALGLGNQFEGNAVDENQE